MTLLFALRLAALTVGLAATFHAHAESFASSASSAGSASSGSISDSSEGSSDSSSDDKKKSAEGDYRIVDVAQAPARPDYVRITMQADEPTKRLTLELPAETFAKQNLGQGDMVSAHKRVYGYEFARGDTQEAFYLVLADDWFDELAPRPVVIL